MIGHEAVGVKAGRKTLQSNFEVQQEGLVIVPVKENGLAAIASVNDVVESAGKMNAMFAGHAEENSKMIGIVKYLRAARFSPRREIARRMLDVRKGIFVLAAILCFVGLAAERVFGGAKEEKRISKIETIYDDKDQRKNLREIRFKDDAGNVKRKLSMVQREYVERGRKIRESANAIEAKGGKGIVVVRKERDLDERNPYKIIRSSGTTISWYDEGGNVRCEMTMGDTASVWGISDMGNSMVYIRGGFDPVSFEVKNDVPGLKSISQLENDPDLTHTWLYVMNDRCQVVFSTNSMTGFGDVKISPSGKWVAFFNTEKDFYDHNFGRWRNFHYAIDVERGRIFTIEWDREITPVSIGDSGVLLGQKYLGPGKTKYRVQGHPSGQKEFVRRRFESYEWKPGDNEFQKTGREIESE